MANCSVHLDNATATSNRALGRGGGLFLAIYGFGGVTTSSIDLLSSTASGNTAGEEGGGAIALVSGSALINTGIAVEIVSPLVDVNNVTVTDNNAGAG